MSTKSSESWDLGLSIGESFAEFSAFRAGDNTPICKSRWYLPRKSLGDGLKDALRAVEAEGAVGGHLRVATDAVARILEKRQGRAPAVLVSQGFETWLSTEQPVLTPPFTTRAAREALPSETEFVFPINGRMSAAGEELVPLALEEVEAVATKLSSLKVKDVAILFLHADQNPEHENQASTLLRDRGYRVFAAHLHAGTPAERWRAAIENAFAESAILEEKEQIEAALKTHAETSSAVWTAEILTSTGYEPIAAMSATVSRDGVKRSLKETLRAPTLHCGLDEFRLFGGPGEALLPLRPTAFITHGAWSFPIIDLQEASGFAPGPMALGKSQRLAIFDVLYVRERLKEVEGLTTLLNEKSRPRILESLFTLAKRPTVGTRERAPDANAIAVDLERAFVERCAIDLAEAGVEKRLCLSGPLAETMKPLIAARRPDIKLTTSTSLDWAESAAVAGRTLSEAQA